MSVTIINYLANNHNKLTALLSYTGLENVFAPSTFIEVLQRQGEWWCDIYLGYTLTCRDIENLSCAFAGYWWSISPYFTNGVYRLSICLKVLDL